MSETDDHSTNASNSEASLPQPNRRIVGAPQRYAKIMVQFLSHRRPSSSYTLADVMGGMIEDEVLVAITPEEVKRFLCQKAYGHPDPGPTDYPTSCRANTLVVYKKAISWFLPRQSHPWDEVGRAGNPTRSSLVNSVVKRVQKYEVRKQGADSQCRRPIEYEEYIQILELLKKQAHENAAYTMVTNKILKTLSLITLQWHTISRVDDMCHFRFSDLTSNPSFKFALSCQLRWSKNIMEERDSPQQIILGSMDPRVCPLLNLIHYIEHSNQNNLLQEGEEFLFGAKGTSDQVRKLLMVLFEDPSFKRLVAGLLGTHSFRKGPATYASRCGLARDVISRRGRWKGGKRMVDTYIDINLPVPDAMAASKLCGPDGACKYVLNKDNISKDWLVQRVSSGAGSVFSRAMAETLSLPLLWAAFEDYRVEKGGGEEANTYIPILSEKLKQQILEAYVEQYGALPAEFSNPVSKVPILPQGFGAQLHMVELHTGTEPPDAEEASGDQIPGAAGRRAPAGGAPILSQSTNHPEAAAALLSQQVTVQRRVEENAMDIKNELTRVAHAFTRQFRNIHNAIKRIAIQPVVRPRRRQEVVESILQNSLSEEELVQGLGFPIFQGGNNAKLYKGVKNLYDLWHEYEFGLAGNKPAKHFTSRERGQCRFLYSRRRVFWDTVQRMINAGHTSDTAVDRVYLVYGRSLAVTYILRKMAADRRTGGHPELQ